MNDIESWYDRDHTHYLARPCSGYICERCQENAAPAVVEVSADPGGGEAGMYVPMCAAHYDAMRADPHHNPGGPHDAYVGLGEAL